MNWHRVSLPRGGHIYQAQTELGTFQLWHRNAARRGRRFKYKVWTLYRNGRVVSGSTRYRLGDAKRFADEYLVTQLEKRLA